MHIIQSTTCDLALYLSLTPTQAPYEQGLSIFISVPCLMPLPNSLPYVWFISFHFVWAWVLCLHHHIKSPGIGITDNCELPWTQVLCRSNKHNALVSHLSSLYWASQPRHTTLHQLQWSISFMMLAYGIVTWGPSVSPAAVTTLLHHLT